MAPKNKVAAPAKKADPAATAKQVNAPPKTVTAPAPTLAQPTTTLAKVQAAPSALVPSAPAWLAEKMKGQAPRGLEKVDRDDLIVPRLVLAQALTPEVVNRQLEVGDIFDNLTKEVLAKAGTELTIIPVALAKSRMYLVPFAEGGGITCRADDAITARPGGVGVDQGENPTRNCADCILKEWDDSEEGGKPGCTLFYNVLVLLPDRGFTAYSWSLKSTQVKVARRFLSTAKQTGADFFAQKYAIKAVPESSGNFNYQNFSFKPIGWVNEQEYQRGAAAYASMHGKTFQADVSDLEHPDTVPVVAEPHVVVAQGAAAEVQAPTAQGNDEEVPF